jgi:hypothetical protein
MRKLSKKKAKMYGLLGVFTLLTIGFTLRFYPTNQTLVTKVVKPKSAALPTFYQQIGDAPKKSAPAPLAASSYTLELFVEPTKEEAVNRIKWLENKGVTAYYTPLQKRGRTFYRVRAGIFGTEEEAVTAKDKIQALASVKGEVGRL